MVDSKVTSVYIDGAVLAQRHKSGIGHLVQNLLSSLTTIQAKDIKYQITLFGTVEERNLLHQISIPDVKIKIIPIPSRRTLNILNYKAVLPPLDLYLGRGIYLFPNYMNYPLTKRSRSLTWIHDLAYIKFPETVSPKLQNNLQNNIVKWINRSNRVITLSEFIKGQIIDTYKVSPNRVNVIACGVDTTHYYARSNEEIAETQHKYGLPSRSILYVGNIEPRKNLEKLVEAYTRLSSDTRAVHSLVLIGGNSWNSENIHNAVNAAKAQGYNIIMPKIYIEDVDLPAILSGAEVLVNPSLYEGFGMTPLEAIACGTKIAISNIPVFTEIYKDYFATFDPDDSSSMAKKIELVLSQDFSDTVTIDSLISKYSWENAAKSLNEVLSKLT